VNSNHETFKLVRAFLLAIDPNSPAADECNAPICRRDLGTNAFGMILMRLVDENGVGINLHNRLVLADMQPPKGGCCDDRNPEASTVTVWPIDPGTTNIIFTVIKRTGFFTPIYGPGTVNGLRITPARTTVPAEVILKKSK
jgi:hypothetical protein